jgi:phosphate transport system substrate-binding protein
MTRKSGPPPIAYMLLLLLLSGAGGYFFLKKPTQDMSNKGTPGSIADLPSTSPATTTAFSPAASLPNGTSLRIYGSTSMVTINQNLKRGFEAQFSGATVTTNANGSEQGLQDLLAGRADLAAISRPLGFKEQNQGLVAVPVATDAIAIVIGNSNPFNRGLTSTDVARIFQGKTNNWSDLGGPAATIRVINRPANSGTHQAFQEFALEGGTFGTTPNITTLPRDETTGLLQALGTDGIGYATYAQIANQKTVRPVAVNGVMPSDPAYPYKRTLYYVYKNPPSAGVQAMLGYINSPQGKRAIATSS